jgi:hypothetical protein
MGETIASITAILLVTYLFFYVAAVGGRHTKQNYESEAFQREQLGKNTIYDACPGLEVTVYLNRGWEIIPTADRYCMKMVWRPKNK